MGVCLLETAQADLELVLPQYPYDGSTDMSHHTLLQNISWPSSNENLDKIHHNAWRDFNLLIFNSLLLKVHLFTDKKHLFNRLSCLTLDKLEWPHLGDGVLERELQGHLIFLYALGWEVSHNRYCYEVSITTQSGQSLHQPQFMNPRVSSLHRAWSQDMSSPSHW